MNYIKLNTDKCHLLISRNRNGPTWVNLYKVWESNNVKLVGITIDKALNFSPTKFFLKYLQGLDSELKLAFSLNKSYLGTILRVV